MYTCETCKAKRKCVKQLTVYKYPQILVIHIKRFRFNSTRREKLVTDVQFPVCGLNLGPYLSPDARQAWQEQIKGAENSNHTKKTKSPGGGSSGTGTGTGSGGSGGCQPMSPIYDLICVSNHHGSLHSGHYIAHAAVSISGTTSSGAGTGAGSGTGGASSGGSGSSNSKENEKKWMCFNDSRVTPVTPSNIAGPTAYVLFYKLQT
jgi:ubiquitin C-terminal hydrolase